MLPVWRWISCGLGAIVGSAALAQAAPTPVDVDESKIPDWVKRQARSPYKVIIESNTQRGKPVMSRDDGTKPAQPKAPAAQPATAIVKTDTRVLAAATAAPMSERAASTPPVEMASAGTVAEPEPESASAPTSVPAAVPAPVLETAAAAAATAATAGPEPATLMSAPLAAPRELTPLQLVNRVEPVFPLDLIDERLKAANVVVGFTVNPDGEVVNPSVTSTSDSRLNRSVLRAVRAWRYAPIDTPRPHAVRFEFTSQ
jgi:TonB family protein